MTILLIEFVDRDATPEEIRAEWEIKHNCLIYYTVVNEEPTKTIIPLYSIFRMTEYTV